MVEEKQKKSKFGSFLKRGKKSSETTKKKVLVKDVPKPVPAVKVALKSQPAPDPAADAPKVVDTPPVSLNAEKDKGGSWLSRTNYFREMSDWAFDVVDTDKSGCVDEKELYSGLLLIHLKLGSYAGPAACKPVGREQVVEIFKLRDLDHSGSLDKDEFSEVMSVLCGNIFTRVAVQWSLTLMIVPLVAQYMLSGVVWLTTFLWDQLTSLDDFEAIEGIFATRMDQFSTWFCSYVPNPLLSGASAVGSGLQKGIDMVPDSVWSTVPVTLISCVLGCLVVPYSIFKIDDYFQSVADKNKTAKQKARQKVEI